MNLKICLSEDNCENQFSNICSSCFYNLDNEYDHSMPKFYSPINVRKPHEADKKLAKLEKQKQNEIRKSERKFAAAKKRADVSAESRKRLAHAESVEKKVFKTINSGRVMNDGDLKTEDLIIDVKSQSKTNSPRIDLDEWKKVQQQARQSGKSYGILALVNNLGEVFYVVPEELFKEKFI